MNCHTCGYGLFGIKGQRCPECGAAFKPSDFMFRRDVVQYSCPHCEKSYVGTAEHGRLAPSEFECAGCRNIVRMDEMSVTPVPGVPERDTRAMVNPWLERKRASGQSLAAAWLSTVRMSLFRPNTLMEATPMDAPVRSGILFLVATSVMTSFIGVFGLVVRELIRRPTTQWWQSLNELEIVFVMIAPVLGTLLTVLIGAVIAHTVLHFGAPPPGGYSRTLNCGLYASGASIALAVNAAFDIHPGPGVGGMLLMWWFLSSIIALRAGQKTSPERASLAVVVAAVGVALLYGFTIFLLIALFVPAI